MRVYVMQYPQARFRHIWFIAEVIDDGRDNPFSDLGYLGLDNKWHGRRHNEGESVPYNMPITQFTSYRHAVQKLREVFPSIRRTNEIFQDDLPNEKTVFKC